MGRRKIYSDEELRNKLKEYQRNYYLKNKEKRKQYKKEHYEVTKQKDNGHSFLSPSSLERAILCPASATLCEGLPDETTVYSKEGTAFHELMEYDNTFVDTIKLEDYFNLAKELLEKYNFSENVLKELSEYWYETSKFIQELKDRLTNKGFEITEYKELKLSMLYSMWDYGTLDLGLDCKHTITGKHMIIILDYKYGKGVDVEVKYNPQLISYTTSFINFLEEKGLTKDDIIHVQTFIYQPRIEHSVKQQAYSLEELDKEASKIEEAVNIAYAIKDSKKDSKDELAEQAKPSEEACKFCRAKSICKKYNEQMLSLLSDLPQVETQVALTNEQIVKVLEFEKNVLPKITEYIKFIKSSVESRLIAGDKINGVHLVDGTSRTQYVNDTTMIVDVLNKEGIDAVDHSIKLRTISDIKKEISKKVVDKDKQESILNTITYKPEAKPKVELFDDVKLVDNLF